MHAAVFDDGSAVFVPPSGIQLANRVRGEFREMPGMRLTLDQATRLWALDHRTCETVLDHLMAAGYLVRDDRGQYQKAHGGY